MAWFTQPDFPFHRGQPTCIGGRGWLLTMASLSVALAALQTLPLHDFPLNILLAVIFTTIPMIALRTVAGPFWSALFRRIGLREVGLAVTFGLLRWRDRWSWP